MGKGFPVTGNPTSYTITIGSGGSGIAASPGSGGATGNNGTDSQFGSLYASGGGAGAGHGNGNARPGGSGGGACETPGTNGGLGNVPFSYGIIQGYPGGGSPLYPNAPGTCGGGGGGAGGSGYPGGPLPSAQGTLIGLQGTGGNGVLSSRSTVS